MLEPNEESFARIVANRPNSINLNRALCETEQSVHFLSKGVVSGIVEYMDRAFLAVHHKPVFREKIQINSIPVINCIPISSLLRSIQIFHIDLWILDVEGAEEAVLKVCSVV